MVECQNVKHFSLVKNYNEITIFQVQFLPEITNQHFEDSDFTNPMSIIDMIFKWCYYVDKFGIMFKSPLHDVKDENSLSNLLDTIKKLLSDFLEDKCPSLLCKCIFSEILLATKSLQMLREHLKENFSVERLFLDIVFIFSTAIHNVCRSYMPPKVVFINVARMLNENEKFVRENFKTPLPENALDVCLYNYNTDICLNTLTDEYFDYGTPPLFDESFPGLEDYCDVLEDNNDDDNVFK